jgi:hypothetical protein
MILAKDGNGTSHHLAIRKVENMQIRDIFVYSLQPQEDGYQVQINLDCFDTNWSACVPILVVDSKSYIELARSDGRARGDTGAFKISPSVSLKVKGAIEANLIKDRFEKLSSTRVP